MIFWLMACAPPDPGPPPADTETTPAPISETSSTTTPAGPVRINEVMPANDSTWLAADGTLPDWVELVTAEEESVDLSRVRLVDGAGNEWTGTGTLAPGEHLLLDALPFGLDKDGDELSLQVDGVVVDRIAWVAQPADTVLARTPDVDGPLTASAWPTPGEPNEPEASPTLDAADGTVFHTRGVHDIDLQVAPEHWAALAEHGGIFDINPDYNEVPAALVIDGIPYPSVGLRRKGNASSADLDTGQPPFKVDLNELVPGTRFRGLKGFNLHNGKVNDPTKCREHVTYLLARESGLMAPRVGWAKVTLNGTYYGLYTLVEQHDDVMMERFRPGQGESGMMVEPNDGGGLLQAGDFGQSGDISWDIEESPTPVDPALIAVIDAVDALLRAPSTDANVTQLWTVADRDSVLDYLAWEAVTGHHDGYLKPNNWRVFVDAETTKLHMVPSGAEWTWSETVDAWEWGGAIGAWCMDNDGCWHDYAERMVQVAELAQALDLAGEFDQISTALGPLVDGDPRTSHGQGAINAARASTLDNLVRFPPDAIDKACRSWPDLCP